MDTDAVSSESVVRLSFPTVYFAGWCGEGATEAWAWLGSQRTRIRDERFLLGRQLQNRPEEEKKEEEE